MKKDLVVQQPSAVPDFAMVANTLKVSPETRKTYKYAMISFKNYCTKHNIQPDLDSMMQWINSVENSSTQATYIASVKKVLNQVFKYDPRLPDLRESLEDLRPVKKDQAISESEYLKKSEVDTLIKLCNPKIGIIIETLFITGLRISELLRLDYKNAVFVEKGKKSYYEIKVVGKRRKENVALISVKLYNKISKMFNNNTKPLYGNVNKNEKPKKTLYDNVNKSENSGFLFNHGGKPYRREYISDEIRKAGLLIDRDISAHTLRHSAACFLRDDRKLSIDKIQKFLNHSSASTTMAFYLHDKPTPDEIDIFSFDK